MQFWQIIKYWSSFDGLSIDPILALQYWSSFDGWSIDAVLAFKYAALQVYLHLMNHWYSHYLEESPLLSFWLILSHGWWLCLVFLTYRCKKQAFQGQELIINLWDNSVNKLMVHLTELILFTNQCHVLSCQVYLVTFLHHIWVSCWLIDWPID